MVVNKWFVAIMQFVVAVIAGLQVVRGDGTVSVEEQWQFAAVVVSAVGVVFLPLLQGGYHAGLKVGIAAVGALIAAAIPLVNQSWTFDSSLIVGLAVVNALLVHFGVQARVDGVKEVLADSKQSDAKAIEVDPVVVAIADQTLTTTSIAGPARHAVG
jgi:hypothetical protein